MHDPTPPINPHSTGAADVRYPGPGKLFIVWTLVGILSSLRFQFQRPLNPELGQLDFTLAFCAAYYPWIALSPLVFRLERRFPLGGAHWVRHVAILALCSVPLCLLASPAMVWLFRVALTIVTPARALRGHFYWLSHFPFAQVVFWCSVAGGYFVRTLFQLREHEQRTARLALEKSQLEAGLKQAQLDVLRARLNPHFLFNSLQNISAMTKQDPQTASRMLARLGDLLRAVLQNGSGPEHPLRDEIELTRAYVALEQMRFGELLKVEFDVPAQTQRALVPCFLLQPLVENAILHGLRGTHKAGIITVTAARRDADLLLTVRDNGVGLPGDGLAGLKIGVGVGSTRQRLATMYAGRQSFTMRTPPEGGAEVHIVIPIHEADLEEEPARNAQPAAADR